MGWRVQFYSTKIMNAIGSWPIRMRTKFLWIVDLIERVGPSEVGMPHIKSLSKGLFEIRVKSNEGIARATFCIMEKQVVIVLSEFIKKTQKTPPKEIELALRRMKEVKDDD